ncbi:hypothetical protein H9P43_004420 [Blastocladiella emersonii ATCC 22665]|nr:hypothetical protein H9P43_004420 [Blastocladiella emersonii ATCC 22665]
MRLNANTILTEVPSTAADAAVAAHHPPAGRLSLVPYLPCHVPKYHEWMQSPELLAATASEPLSLREEYAMQQSWREDPDKLTFILAWSGLPLNYDPAALTRTDEAEPDEALALDPAAADQLRGLGGMVGDVNLFFHPYYQDDDEEDADAEPSATDSRPLYRTAEVEIMVAEPSARGHGLAQRALAWIMAYARAHIRSDLRAAVPSHVPITNVKAAPSDAAPVQPAEVSVFRAIVGWDNVASRKLFESKLRFKECKSVDVFRETHLEWKWPEHDDWPFPHTVPKYHEAPLHPGTTPVVAAAKF